MRNHEIVKSHEYKNDYFYIVIRQVPEHGVKGYAYCCGINISRFDPVCWRKAGICSNPAFKGLQLLRADVSALAKKLGVDARNAEHIPCAPMTPHVDGWYRESTLLLDTADSRLVRKILEFSVIDLVKTVLAVCAPEAKVPARLISPPEMHKFLESLSVKDFRGSAPSSAKPGQ